MSWAFVEPFLDAEVPPRFIGRRSFAGRAFVTVECYDQIGNTRILALAPRLDLANHSPDGFEWGYCGSGPSQLAIAMAAFALDDDGRALQSYKQLLIEVIASIPQDGPEWHLDVEEVRKFCQLAPVRVA